MRAHARFRTAEASVGWWAGGGGGLLGKIPCNFLAASPALLVNASSESDIGLPVLPLGTKKE